MMDGLTRDILIMGLTAYAEARSEGQAGIRAQVHSVINRHAAGHWYSRKTLAGTCFFAYAYSAFNSEDPNREIAAEAPMDDPIVKMCMDEAEQAITGVTDDPTAGATHYYAEGSPEPSWVLGIDAHTGLRVAPPATFCVKIGRHLFYRDVQ